MDTNMLQKTVKAAAVATDQGSFTAVAAAWTVDRDNEQISRGAFASTIKAWQDRNKPVPLHWNHQGDAKNVIGTVDPHTMAETEAGLYVEGQLHIEDSEVAKEAWRLVKADAVGLSFGFMAKAQEREDGSREIVDIDLFEVSLTPAPANPDTKLLSFKTPEALRAEAEKVELDLERELNDQKVPEVKAVEPVEVEREDLKVEELTAELEQVRDQLEKHLQAPEASGQRREASKVERELREEKTPELKGVPEPEREPEPDPVTVELTKKVDALTAQLENERQRREARKVERELEERMLPVVEEKVALAEKQAQILTALTENVESLAGRIDDLATQQEKREAPSAEELRVTAEKTERELVEDKNPELKGPPEPSPTVEEKTFEALDALSKQLAALGDRMEKLETSVVEEAHDEERFAAKSRTQDTLRKQAEDQALEFASDGLSLRKPPQRVEEPKPEAPPTGTLRRRGTDLYLELLTE